jgi:hypothetical protein
MESFIKTPAFSSFYSSGASFEHKISDQNKSHYTDSMVAQALFLHVGIKEINGFYNHKLQLVGAFRAILDLAGC